MLAALQGISWNAQLAVASQGWVVAQALVWVPAPLGQPPAWAFWVWDRARA